MSKSCGKWPIGVCSWSFQKGIPEIASVMTALDVDHIHLALAPALEKDGDAYLAAVRQQKWTITSTMLSFAHEDYSTLDTIKKTGGIAPDELWDSSREAFRKACAITKKLRVKYISLHVGFLDHTNAAYARKFTGRVKTLGDLAAGAGISLLMETGQETAEELERFVTNLKHDHIFLNFDPANLILYNKDEPLKAVKRLAPWIRHVHIKDAIRTLKPGTWGAEAPWGSGEVNSFAFLDALESIGYKGPLAIEREGGTERVKDISTAVRRLAAW